MFFAVSMKVSPFETLLVEAEKSTVSAPKRRAASEKLVRVRVEFSKNSVTQVLPFRSGSCERSWAIACLKTAALSRISVISSAERSSKPKQMPPRPTGGNQPDFVDFASHVDFTDFGG